MTLGNKISEETHTVLHVRDVNIINSMESFRIIAFVMLLFSGLDGVLIQTSSDLTLGVTPLDVRCSPANSELIMYVNSFTLHRNGTPVAKVTYNRTAQNTNLIVLDVTNNRGRYNLTGNVHDSNPVNKFLRVVVPANLTSCLDEANYTCLLSAQDKDHANYEDQVSRYVGVKTGATAIDGIYTPPTNDNMLDPSGGGRFLVGSTYRFTCTGIVGRPPVNLRWCYKQEGEMGFAPLISYTADITESEPEVYQDCNNRRQSFLNYTITTVDMNTVLLCEPASGMYYCGNGAVNKTFVVRAYSPGGGTYSGCNQCQLSIGLLFTLLIVTTSGVINIP